MCVHGALLELERGEHAEDGNGSRDFGRGVKYACDLIRSRLAEGALAEVAITKITDAVIFDKLESETGVVIDVEFADVPDGS